MPTYTDQDFAVNRKGVKINWRLSGYHSAEEFHAAQVMESKQESAGASIGYTDEPEFHTTEFRFRTGIFSVPCQQLAAELVRVGVNFVFAKSKPEEGVWLHIISVTGSPFNGMAEAAYWRIIKAQEPK